MAQVLYEISQGLRFLNGTSILFGSGAPGGDTGYQDEAAQGSVYYRTSNGAQYNKTASGTGASAWTENNTSGGGVSMLRTREPVLVADTTTFATITVAATALNSTGLGGLTAANIPANSRVLLTDLTTGTENVYIVTGTPGSAATLVQSTDTPDAGDTTIVTAGTYANILYYYTGSSWLTVSDPRLAAVASHAGVSLDGTTQNNYASNNFIDDGDSLLVATGKLDAQVSTNANNVALARTTQMQASVGSTETIIDQVSVDTYQAVKYLVVLKGASGAERSRVYATEITIAHDGHAGADATVADFSLYGILQPGTTNLANVEVTADITGTGTSQVMRLKVRSPTTTVKVEATRNILVAA